MNLLVIGDNHNDIENMLTFLDKLKGFNFDVIVYTGDFTDVNVRKGFSQEDIAKIILEELKMLGKPVVAVPGNNDNFGIVDLIEKEGISIHGKGKIINNVGFYGYGGARTPFRTQIEPSETELKEGLEKAWKDVVNAKMKIQVTHAPPINTRVDLTAGGVHAGSEVVRSFINEKKPIVAVSGHIHESRGTDWYGETFLINPGRLSEGYFGLVTIIDNQVTGKVLNLIQ